MKTNMLKWLLLLWCIFAEFGYGQEQEAVSPSPVQDSEADKGFIKNNEWENDMWDIRVLDIPKIGVLYDLNASVLFRISLPITWFVVLIPPLSYTYASSYWGIDTVLMDVTLGVTSISPFKFSSEYVLRFFPTSVWGGIPLSAKGIGLYALLELAPLSLFSNAADNYAAIHVGIGINVGLKIIITHYVDIDLKYENYLAYTDVQVRNSYIGVYFHYRISGPGNYLPYL